MRWDEKKKIVGRQKEDSLSQGRSDAVKMHNSFQKQDRTIKKP